MFGRELEQAPPCRRSARRTWVRRAPDRDASCLLDCKSCLWKYTAARTLHGCQQSGGWAGKRMWRRRTTAANTEEFAQKLKQGFCPTCFDPVNNHLWLVQTKAALVHPQTKVINKVRIVWERLRHIGVTFSESTQNTHVILWSNKNIYMSNPIFMHHLRTWKRISGVNSYLSAVWTPRLQTKWSLKAKKVTAYFYMCVTESGTRNKCAAARQKPHNSVNPA